jgi:hypothetical protein
MRFSLKLAQSTQPGETHPKFSTERQTFGSRGHFLGKTPPEGISSQNTLLNNFSPVQPILTCKTPVESAQLAETRGVIKIIANPLLGEQSGNFQKSCPLNNFSTVRPIFTCNMLIDSAKQGEQN